MLCHLVLLFLRVHRAYFQHSGENITHDKTKTRASETHAKEQSRSVQSEPRAPIRSIVVADSLEWLLFLTEINFYSLETFGTKKPFENFIDARVSACACAKVRDQCFWPSSAFGCAWSNSIVPVCLRSVKFLRVRMQCCVALVSLGLPQSNSIASCALVCARSSSLAQ